MERSPRMVAIQGRDLALIITGAALLVLLLLAPTEAQSSGDEISITLPNRAFDPCQVTINSTSSSIVYDMVTNTGKNIARITIYAIREGEIMVVMARNIDVKFNVAYNQGSVPVSCIVGPIEGGYYEARLAPLTPPYEVSVVSGSEVFKIVRMLGAEPLRPLRAGESPVFQISKEESEEGEDYEYGETVEKVGAPTIERQAKEVTRTLTETIKQPEENGEGKEGEDEILISYRQITPLVIGFATFVIAYSLTRRIVY